MRSRCLLAGLIVMGAVNVSTAAAPPTTVQGPVFTKLVPLLDDAALAALKASNPHDYAIAREVLRKARYLCSPAKAGAPLPVPVSDEAQDVSCSAGFWLTSQPPKRQLSFRIADTFYWTLVSVAVDARPQPAQVTPASPNLISGK